MLLAFYKPYGVLSQFTPDEPGQQTLASFGFPAKVYPLGRLDRDSEGLLLLSDEARLNARLLEPGRGHWRRYLVQVEGVATGDALRRLRSGVLIQKRRTLPSKAEILPAAPEVPPRDPPIRERKNIPTTWLGIELTEGRNRQVRRMTAAVGLPTLRLIRTQIGAFALPGNLTPGQWRALSQAERNAVFRTVLPGSP